MADGYSALSQRDAGDLSAALNALKSINFNQE
ncbi:Uncharacterised protein [Hafnia alvei]|nr:Uncharacterised protein [Hafnia alvei]